jgi:uncharacterized phage protein gp47/JayE
MSDVTPVSNIPISVDYTSKDYYVLRDELIARVQDRIPEWTASDPSDFGVALIEAFAYMGDLISYYIDRNANEALITTATQRDSVINIAQTYGYTPAGYRQAFTLLTLSNTSAEAVLIPAGTVVSGEVISGDTVTTVYFTVDSDVTIDPQVGDVPGTEDVSALEGRFVTIVSDNANIYGELIGTSTGLPNMSFELGEVPSVDGTTELYVQDGDVYSKWTQVQHLLDNGPTDLVYQVNTDANNNVLITFGDGVSGVIPTIHSEIRANYMVGGGLIGNVPSDTLVDIVYVPGLSTNETTALQSIITVTNADSAIGGSDPETTNQIRVSAPASLRAANRAVTLQDYADLSLSVSGVGKANAYAEIWTSVTVYLAPSRSSIDSDLAPGLDDLGAPTLEYDRLKEDVETYLSDKLLLGTTVTIQPPTYVDLIITLQYAKLDQYTTTEVELAVKQALLTSFGYNGMDFQDTIYPQDIEFALNQVPGVKTVKVTNLHIEGDTGLNTVVGAEDEIFRFQEDNISIGTI